VTGGVRGGGEISPKFYHVEIRGAPYNNNYFVNPIKHGRGGSKCPRHFKMFVVATGAYKSDPDFFTFPIYLLTKDLTKNFEKKFGGSPHFSPSKMVAQENDPAMATYDPHFLSQNMFLL